MSALAWAFVALAVLGILQALAGWALAQRFAGRGWEVPAELPAITVLKPLHGDEPLLEEALASLLAQDYPRLQVVCGVQDTADPAQVVVARLRARFPDADIALVVDPTAHGANRKVGNLINMVPAAKHDVLVIADSDVHAAPDYLAALAATLARPGVGLATTLYVGLRANDSLPARLGAGWINHIFLPGALLGRALGRQDCLGATMALRRETLAGLGGLEVLADHLADDNVLGQKVRALGLEVALAPAVVATTVAEDRLRALWRHELRWARTIRALAPGAFAASALQYKLVWAALAVAAAPGWQSLCFFGLIWASGALAARGTERALAPRLKGLAFAAPVWLLPLREALSFVILLASYAGNRVEWRGHVLSAAPSPPTSLGRPPR